jgi:hypothetical protein
MDKVELYESNAGHLFLIHGDKVWAEMEQTGSNFREDAEAILRGDTESWTVQTFKRSHVNVIDTCQFIATCAEDGFITMHSTPGMAASQYILGEMEYPEWVPEPKYNRMAVYRRDAENSSYPFVEMV